MKTFYKWFDYLLTLLLAFTILVCAVITYLLIQSKNSSVLNSTFGKELSIAATSGIIASFVIGLLYIILGIIFLIMNRGKKGKTSFAKRLVVKGIISSILSFVLFFFLGLIISFYGLTLSGSNLPTIN